MKNLIQLLFISLQLKRGTSTAYIIIAVKVYRLGFTTVIYVEV